MTWTYHLPSCTSLSIKCLNYYFYFIVGYSYAVTYFYLIYSWSKFFTLPIIMISHTKAYDFIFNVVSLKLIVHHTLSLLQIYHRKRGIITTCYLFNVYSAVFILEQLISTIVNFLAFNVKYYFWVYICVILTVLIKKLYL